jgi:hypothetical protein
MTPLFEVSAPVDAGAAEVRRVIDDDWLLRVWLPGIDPASLTVDRAPGMLAVQGGWWYRGELSVVESPEGVRLVHRVTNVAAYGRWAVPLANRLFLGYRAKLQSGVNRLARQIEQRLVQPPGP